MNYVIVLVYAFCASKDVCTTYVHSAYTDAGKCHHVLSEQRKYWKLNKMADRGMACLGTPIVDAQ